MAQQLKNTLAFSLAAGATIALPHGLQLADGTRLAPDVVFLPSENLGVVTDDVNVTLTNQSGTAAAGSVLVEAWHTIERAFGGNQNLNLLVKPYIVVSVDGGNQPSWPAFPVNQPPRIIYARLTGNDTTGDGSLVKPYRTFQRAIRDVPPQLVPGVRWLIDITGSSTVSAPEIFPPNYALPPLDAPFGIEGVWSSPFAASYYPFTTMLGVDIIAKPQLAVLAGASSLTVGTEITSVTIDADTNLVVIHTNQNYGVADDTLKGKLVQDGVGLRGVIWRNTGGNNSTIYLTIPHTPDEFILPVFSSNLTGFPPGFPPGFPVPFDGTPTPTLQIVERSAYWTTQKDPTNLIQGGLLIAACGALSIRGVDIELAAPFQNPAAYDLEIFRSATICIEGCSIDGLLAIHSSGQICVINTHIHDAVIATEAPIGMFSVLCENIPSFGTTWVTPTAFTVLGFVLDGCAAVGPRYHPLQPIGRGPMMDLQLRSGVIMNSIPDLNSGLIAAPQNFPAPFVPNSINPALAVPGHGLLLVGGHAIVDHVKIFGCPGNAIHVEGGGGFIELKSITGGHGGAIFGGLTDTPNGGAGLLLTDGAYCRVSDKDPTGVAAPATNVTGTAGDANIGDTPIVTTWAAVQGGAQTFDIVGATASGSRLFAKP